MEYKKQLQSIIDHHGKEAQIRQTIEEMSELTQALCKADRYKDGDTIERMNRLNAIIDEIADVQIMLDQLRIVYACEMDVDERIRYKIHREIGRM